MYSRVAFLVMFLAITACDGHKPSDTQATPKRIVALGDSLTAGYGLQPGESYPDQLQAALEKEGIFTIIDNAGVTGDTTAGGLARLEQSIAGDVKPSLVIVALGANDMLRAVSPHVAKENLRKILQSLKDKKIPVLLYGIQASAMLPFIYGGSFSNMYDDLADEFDVPLYPSFLKGVAMKSELNLSDGLHPNKQGVAVMVEKTLPMVEDALD